MSSASARPEPREAAGAPPRITWAGGIVALLVGGILALLAAEIALRIAMPHWREFWSGWFITSEPHADGVVAIGRPGYRGTFAQNNGDFRVEVRINEIGLRNDAPAAAANGQVWVVGDSMSFGWGVETEQTYAKVAERAAGRGVYNVASPGTDVVGYQVLLQRMPAGVRPAAVIVGLVLENDVVDYRARRAPASQHAASARGSSRDWLKMELTANSALYNFFAVSLKRSDVVTNFLVSIGFVEPAQGYRHVLDGVDVDELIDQTAGELANLQRLLPQDAPLGVLVIPSRFEIRDNDPLYRGLRTKMLAALAARGIATIDVLDGFRSAGFAATHFAHDGHWNARGHEIAGQAVAAWLRTKGLAQ